MVSQSIVHEFCRSGAHRRLDRDRQGRARRARRRADGGARAHLPDAQFLAPEGGYFMWVELPEDADVDAMFAAAEERGVQFVKGTDFLLEGGEQHAAARLLRRHAEQIDEGVARLAEAYNSRAALRPRHHGEGVEEVGDDVVGPPSIWRLP